MQLPYPLPFGDESGSRLTSKLSSYMDAIGAEDLDHPEFIAELDSLYSSLRKMANDPLYAKSAMGLEIKLVSGLRPQGTSGEHIRIEVIELFLGRYQALSYPISALAQQALESAGQQLSTEELKAILAQGDKNACLVLNTDLNRLDERPLLSWGLDISEPMFSLTTPIALYLIDPELLGIHIEEHERYFALRTMEASPLWKKKVASAELLLTTKGIEHARYSNRIENILGRHDWVRPREVNLALSMINSKFNYARIIDNWPDKGELLDKLGLKLTSYRNKKPWLKPYCTLITYICHSIDLKGDHPTINSMMDTLMLPQYLHRDDAQSAIETLSSLSGRLGATGLERLDKLKIGQALPPYSKSYFDLLSEAGLENQALNHLKALCSKDPARLIRLMRQTGLQERHKVPSKALDQAFSIDLGL